MRVVRSLQALRGDSFVSEKNKTNQTPKGSPQVISLTGIPSSAAVGTPTIWLTYRFAAEWFNDALQEARTGMDHHSRRREVIFAVCTAESYILEWIRDEVLNRDFQRLNNYFPPGRWMNVTDKWKKIPKQLLRDGLIPRIPNLENPGYWGEWLKLIEYRNGLIHARASRPETASLSEIEKPVPSKALLDSMSAGWPTRVVVELIRRLHAAVGTLVPGWVQEP
jgi:hypothetical protein